LTDRGERATRRAEQRRTEREQRKQRMRRSAAGGSGPPMLLLTAVGIAIGVVVVIAFLLLKPPPAAADLQQPTYRTPTQLADGLSVGQADAPVTIELWSDFQCPACGLFVESIEPRLIADYVTPSRARLVYRDIAFLGRGSYDESLAAAVAARCASRDNLFWPYHDYLFANQAGENRGAFAQPTLEAIASAVGLDTADFRACQADPAVAQAVRDTTSAAGAAGVTSTPTVDISGQRLVGVRDYAEYQQLIDQALAAARR
jgi:protein-disulfide isomerase